MHQGIYLLHAPLLAVIMEICPIHIRRCISARNAGPEFCSDYTASDNGA